MIEIKSYGIDPEQIDRYYFPANTRQFQDLVGKMLTQVEAMNLRESVEKANKDIVRQMLWKWWNDVQENSMTSYKLCIGPIIAPNDTGVVSDKPHIWHTRSGKLDTFTKEELTQDGPTFADEYDADNNRVIGQKTTLHDISK